MDILGLVPFFWIIVGIMLVGLEMVIPGFIIFFFGAGGIITGIISLIFGGLSSNFLLQAGIWVGSSVLSLVFLRKYLSKVFTGTLFNQTREKEQVLGASAEVISEITPEQAGRIKFQGTSWNAISYTETLKVGEKVEIISKEGSTFVVTRSIMEEE
jgi:inner membrane protein